MIKYVINKIGRYSLIMTVCFSFWFVNSSQSPASVVYDPTNASNIMNLGKTMDKLKEMKENIMNNTQFINNVLSNSNELKRLMSILDNMVCATDHFDIYMGLIGDITVCNKKLKIDMTLSRLDGISGKTKSIMSGVYSMTQYESVQSLKDLNDELEQSIKELNKINTQLRIDVLKKLKAKNLKENGHEKFSFTHKVNL